MTKLSSGNFLVVILALAFLQAAPALAHLNTVPPMAAIEYDANQAIALHGSAEAWSKTAPILLHDLVPNDATYWMASTVTELTTLRGYAHIGPGGEPGTQQTANANITYIQIWGWHDTNGNGAADANDATTAWVKLVELQPSAGDGNAVGWNIPYPVPAIPTSTWRGDLLQGHTITLTKGQSWLLLVRVVDISGNTNLMQAVAGLEQWDSGIAGGPGSGVDADRYVDSNGNTPGTTDQRIQDDDVVWIYVPRLK